MVLYPLRFFFREIVKYSSEVTSEKKMTECSDADIFADFDDRMDTAPIQLGDSDDSFDEGFQKNPSAIDEKSVIEEYRKLKEESKRIDEVAVQVTTSKFSRFNF